MTSPLLDVQSISKVYHSGATALTVLREVSFTLESGTTSALVGPSGSGKTTLLGICAGLDRPTAGTVRLDGVTLNALDEEALAALRSTAVGFIFQTFQLVPTLTALENVMVPLELRGERHAKPLAVELLHRVGLSDRPLSHPTVWRRTTTCGSGPRVHWPASYLVR